MNCGGGQATTGRRDERVCGCVVQLEESTHMHQGHSERRHSLGCHGRGTTRVSGRPLQHERFLHLDADTHARRESRTNGVRITQSYVLLVCKYPVRRKQLGPSQH